MSRLLTLSPLAAALALTAALSPLAACSPAREATPPSASAPAVAVTIAPVVSVEWPARVEAGGVLEARTTATIASRLVAPVASVRARPGDRVRRGQVLVELEDAALVASAERAAASVESATNGRAAAAADIDAADAALVLAKATHERLAALHAAKAATAQELDQAVAGLAAAESRAKAARARLREADAGLGATTAARRAADANAADRTLVAPFDGVIVARSVDPGSMATPGAPLLTLESAGPLDFVVRLDASRAATLRTGQTATVTIDSDPAGTPGREGRVTEIARVNPDGSVGSAAHSFTVKLALTTTDGWRSGLFGRARFAGAPRPVVAVPEGAVVRRGQLTFVFVAADGHARLRAVSLGDTSGGAVEILDGVTPGEAVLLAPPPQLVDGAAITTGKGASR